MNAGNFYRISLGVGAGPNRREERHCCNQIVLVLVLVLEGSVYPELSVGLLDLLSRISRFFLSSTRTKFSSTSTSTKAERRTPNAKRQPLTANCQPHRVEPGLQEEASNDQNK